MEDEILNAFRQAYPDLSAMQVASGFLPAYKTVLVFVVGRENKVNLLARDKDGDGQWHSLADDVDDMRFLAKLFSQGITFRYLLENHILTPTKERKDDTDTNQSVGPHRRG